MRKPLIILVLTWLPLCGNPIRGQAPSVGINASQKQPNNASGAAQTPKDRGTKENPLVVDTLGHQQTPEEREEAQKQAAKAEAQEQNHRSVDRWTLRWNALAAISTGVLVFVGIGGTIAAVCTLRTINAQAREMRRQNRNIVRQSAILDRQTAVAEKALVLAQRPSLVVRNLFFTDWQSGPRLIRGIQAGSFAAGQLYIANHGGTDATIEEVFCEAAIMKEPLPMKRPYEGLIGEQERRKIAPGASITWIFGRKEVLGQAEVQALEEPYSSQFFYVYGWIGYRDDLGIYRKTNFCRKFAKRENRFVPVDNPDYEYEA